MFQYTRITYNFSVPRTRSITAMHMSYLAVADCLTFAHEGIRIHMQQVPGQITFPMDVPLIPNVWAHNDICWRRVPKPQQTNKYPQRTTISSPTSWTRRVLLPLPLRHTLTSSAGRKWMSCSPAALFDCPVVKHCSPDYEPIMVSERVTRRRGDVRKSG